MIDIAPDTQGRILNKVAIHESREKPYPAVFLGWL